MSICIYKIGGVVINTIKISARDKKIKGIVKKLYFYKTTIIMT